MKKHKPPSRWLVDCVLVLFLTVLVLPLLTTVIVKAAAPSTPTNVSPVDGATDISLTWTLQSSAFNDGDGDTHTASQWQIREDGTPTDFSENVFDSGIDTTNKINLAIPSGTLRNNTKYYWRVRHQDNRGEWSNWSWSTVGTSFTTIANLAPYQPTNSSPANAATGISLTPTLASSAFSDPDTDDTHIASQWQVTTTSGNYTSPVYDSGIDTTKKTSISIPSGNLSYGTTYYWHVRYQDSYGNWSAYSTETSFTPGSSIKPNTPSNTSPAGGASDISLTPVLKSSAFSDADAGDSHVASQWQIRTTSGDYTNPVYDSGTHTSYKTRIPISSGYLVKDTTYYWHVRHQDSYGNWSAYSSETSFTTTTTDPQWTFIMYFDGDNDVEEHAIAAFNELEIVGSTKDINIVVLMDRVPGYDNTNGDWTGTKLFYVTQDADTSNIKSVEIADWWEQNMGHPNTLEDFATWTINNYPADNYALVLFDHGDVQGICWDETSGDDYLTAEELKQALRDINNNTGKVLDILAFEACLLGMAEIDYQIRDYVNIRIGSEELMPVAGLPYDDIFTALAADPDMTPSELATQIVNDYIASFTPAVVETLSAVDLSYSATLAAQVSDFAQSMMNSGEWDDIAAANADAEEFMFQGYDDGYSDLYHFAQLVRSYISDTAVQAEALEIMNTITSMVIAEKHGMIHSNSSGISIYFPESESAYWADYCENMDFVADTQWDEFLLAYWAAVTGKPDTPGNISPANGAIDISLSHVFQSSAFGDEDGDLHYASRWQIREDGTAADYSSLAFDSGVDTDNLIDIEIPSGVLNSNTLYWWHVSHQDDTGVWSDWSTETSFTTIDNLAPNQPINSSPADAATSIGLTHTLASSVFSDSDTNDTHAASQWQISTTSGDYSSTVYDSGIDTTHKTSITIPSSANLSYNTTYYWHVRYQDNHGNWSSYSAETSFTTVASGAPSTPTNSLPAEGATGISLTPTLAGSAFSDPDTGDTHTASRWQIRAASGNYTSPLFDSGINTANKTSIAISPGTLNYNTTYYWHVMYQDGFSHWSGWSVETSFTTISNSNPDKPTNSSPANTATGIGITPTLISSTFSDSDEYDTHAASQWQVSTTSGNYTSTVYDSGTDTTNKTSIIIPSAKLNYGTKYYWHVMYKDSYGNWSVYSSETYFTTIVVQSPRQPTISSPSDEATGVSLTPTLASSAFSDPDTGDSHAASQWQIATDEQFSEIVYDSDVDTTHKTSIAIPSGTLSYNTTYYWHVMYEDSHDKWSSWSAEASFTTQGITAYFSADPTQAEPLETIIFTDLSSTSGVTSWTWNFGDGVTIEWTSENKPETGTIGHRYSTVGSYTVSLTITGAAGTNTKSATNYITISEAAAGGGLPWTTIGIAVAAVLVAAIGVLLYIRSR